MKHAFPQDYYDNNHPLLCRSLQYLYVIYCSSFRSIKDQTPLELLKFLTQGLCLKFSYHLQLLLVFGSLPDLQMYPLFIFQFMDFLLPMVIIIIVLVVVVLIVVVLIVVKLKL